MHRDHGPQDMNDSFRSQMKTPQNTYNRNKIKVKSHGNPNTTVEYLRVNTDQRSKNSKRVEQLPAEQSILVEQNQSPRKSQEYANFNFRNKSILKRMSHLDLIRTSLSLFFQHGTSLDNGSHDYFG